MPRNDFWTRQRLPAPEAAKPEATPVRMDENLLNDAEKQAVEAFSKKIDLTTPT
ncbi:MAG: hypothetical protein ACLTYN_13665 [Dysosmobacter welbionis]